MFKSHKRLLETDSTYRLRSVIGSFKIPLSERVFENTKPYLNCALHIMLNSKNHCFENTDSKKTRSTYFVSLKAPINFSKLVLEKLPPSKFELPRNFQS